MQRTSFTRIDPKRRADVDFKKRQFAKPTWREQEYKHRLNFYILPPTAEITLEEFEEWAIARLKGKQRCHSPTGFTLEDHHAAINA